jgi:hypothetical protein
MKPVTLIVETYRDGVFLKKRQWGIILKWLKTHKIDVEIKVVKRPF